MVTNKVYMERKVTVDTVVAEILKVLGTRAEALQRDMDKYQIFWLAVLEAMPKADKTPDPIPYLIRTGYGAIHNSNKAEGSRMYVSYCPKCHTYHYFTKNVCPRCNTGLRYLERHETINDTGDPMEFGVVLGTDDKDLDMTMTIQQFVDQLEGLDRYIAKRWMLDHLELYVDNYQKQIAVEVGLTQSGVARRVMKLKKAFRVWYNQ